MPHHCDGLFLVTKKADAFNGGQETQGNQSYTNKSLTRALNCWGIRGIRGIRGIIV